MTVVIKRYPNRKLYNTDTKSYITLDGIAELIRASQEVQVIDHATDDDLTTLTLSQIIFEQEKKQTGSLPKSVLTGLIQAGNESFEAFKRTLTSPLEMLTPVEQEIEKRINALMQRGEMAWEEGQRVRNKLLGIRPKKPNVVVEERVEVKEVNPPPPSAEEIRVLSSQVKELTQKLNKLVAAQERREV